MTFIVLFALSLAGMGFFYGQNPHAPNAPLLIKKTHSDLLTEETASRTLASLEDSGLPYSSKGLHLTPRLGYETTYYNQTGTPSFTQTAVRANIDLTWFIPKTPLELDLRFNFTALPVTSSPSNLTARFFGGNADLGYSVVKTSFLNFKVLGGVYYTEMYATDRSFGYPRLIIPELFPQVTFYLFDSVTVDATYRFMYAGGLFDTSQLQIVRSLGLSIFMNHNHALSILLEDNGFSLLFPSSILVQYYSVGVTFGYSF